MNISLGDKFESFVARLIRSGRYVSSSEVMRAGLRLLMQHEESDKVKLEALRADVQKGIAQADRGEFVDVNLRDILAEADGKKPRRARR
jgi:antitoxin ParD1/3/4